MISSEFARVLGPGFMFSPNIVPTLAAKNVQCEYFVGGK